APARTPRLRSVLFTSPRGAAAPPPARGSSPSPRPPPPPGPPPRRNRRSLRKHCNRARESEPNCARRAGGAQPVVIEGMLVVIRHPARGQFRAVVELQVREARRGRGGGRERGPAPAVGPRPRRPAPPPPTS